MRSWHRLAIAALLAAGCGDDIGGGTPPPDPDACEASYLDHSTFGEPFLLDWCSGCHSAALPATMRQNAPADVNFDTIEDVRRFGDRIAARGAGPTPTMPPAGGPSAEERALLAEWISCGAK
jgi:uncharacterized membrane protein